MYDILDQSRKEEDNKYQFINNEIYYDKWTKNDKRTIHRRILNILNPYEKKKIEQQLINDFAFLDEDNDNDSVFSNC